MGFNPRYRCISEIPLIYPRYLMYTQRFSSRYFNHPLCQPCSTIYFVLTTGTWLVYTSQAILGSARTGVIVGGPLTRISKHQIPFPDCCPVQSRYPRLSSSSKYSRLSAVSSRTRYQAVFFSLSDIFAGSPQATCATTHCVNPVLESTLY